jgi:entericidin B
MEEQVGTFARYDFNIHHRRSKMIRKIAATLFATLFLAGVFGTLAGCNTIEGAGTDIQQGGKAIKDEAHEQKNKM